jgi:hypothetical protein
MFFEHQKQRHQTLIAACIFIVLTVVLTYPLAFHMNNHLIGRGTADVWQFPWNNFIFKERILTGKDPYFTDRIYYPVGTSLLLHTNTEFNSVVGFLLSPVLTELGQMNAALLLSSFLSALGTYLLTFRLTRSFAGSLFAGIAFAFCPFQITRYFGHINFSITQMLPFGLWAFLLMADKQKLRYGALTGLFFALAYYSNQYYMMFLIISFSFMTVYGLWKIPSWRTKQFFKSLCLTGLVAAVLLSQVAWHFVQDKREKVIAQHPATGGLAAKGSADLSDYFIPGPMSGLAVKIYGMKYAGPHYKITTGLIVLTLAIAGLIVAIRRRNQPVILIGLLGILFLLITLGQYLQIAGIRIPLPYYVMMKIPYMNHVRLPYRAAPMVALTFAVVAGYGISILYNSKIRWRKGIVAIFMCGLIFEIAQIPLALTKFDVPDVYYTIREMEHGTMLTLPFENNVANAAHQMKYQIVHRKDLLNGRTARASPLRSQEAYLQTIPVAKSFEGVTRTHGRRPILQDVEYDRQAAPAFRRFFNVRYLAIHDRYAGNENVLKYVETVFPDARLLSKQNNVQVYELPKLANSNVIEPDETSLRLFLFSGWKPKGRKLAIAVENEAKLLLPPVSKDQKLSVVLLLKSRDRLALNGGKALFKIKNKVVAEATLKKRFEELTISIPGEQILDGRRLLKVELVDPDGDLLKFPDQESPKLDLDLVRFEKR